MGEVGQRFQDGKAFVPQLLMAGRAMKGALEPVSYTHLTLLNTLTYFYVHLTSGFSQTERMFPHVVFFINFIKFGKKSSVICMRLKKNIYFCPR